jgi:hypothetical protein
MELFYAPVNIRLKLALSKNYAIMLSTSVSADDSESRPQFFPPGKRSLQHSSPGPLSQSNNL